MIADMERIARIRRCVRAMQPTMAGEMAAAAAIEEELVAIETALTSSMAGRHAHGVLRWVLTSLGIIGAALNAFQIGFCFILWSVGNMGWIMVNQRRRQYQEALLFFAYLITSLIGLFVWGM